VVAVLIWPATSSGALGVFEPMPTLPVAIRVDVVIVDVAFKELTPSVENIVVPPLPPVPGAAPLILDTVRVDRERLFEVMLDTDNVEVVIINPVSIEINNVDPVSVDTDMVDPIMDDAVMVDPVRVDTDRADPAMDEAVSVDTTVNELTFKVEYAATPGAPLLILETVNVDNARLLDVIVDPDSVE